MSEATNVKRVIVLDDHVDVRLVLNSITTIVSTSSDIAYRHSSPNYTNFDRISFLLPEGNTEPA